MLLHEQDVGTRRMHRDAMDAVADFGVGVGDALRVQPAIGGTPGPAAVVAAEYARRRDGAVQPPAIARILDDGMQAQSAGPRLPRRTGVVAAQSGQFMPTLTA